MLNKEIGPFTELEELLCWGGAMLNKEYEHLSDIEELLFAKKVYRKDKIENYLIQPKYVCSIYGIGDMYTDFTTRCAIGAGKPSYKFSETAIKRLNKAKLLGISGVYLINDKLCFKEQYTYKKIPTGFDVVCAVSTDYKTLESDIAINECIGAKYLRLNNHKMFIGNECRLHECKNGSVVTQDNNEMSRLYFHGCSCIKVEVNSKNTLANIDWSYSIRFECNSYITNLDIKGSSNIDIIVKSGCILLANITDAASRINIYVESGAALYCKYPIGQLDNEDRVQFHYKGKNKRIQFTDDSGITEINRKLIEAAKVNI